MGPRDWWLASGMAAGGLIAGFLLAHVVHDDDTENRPAVISGARSRATSAEQRVMPGASQVALEDIRRVVREELAAKDAEEKRDVSPAPLAPAYNEEPPSEAAQAAASRGREVLAAAIGRRQWTHADADALRAQFHLMAAEDQSELLRQFSQAVNQGKLVPETDGLPF